MLVDLEFQSWLACWTELVGSRYVECYATGLSNGISTGHQECRQGHVMGEFELAGLYREGKGTAQDAAKAQYWQTQAKHAQEAAKMRAFNAKNEGIKVMEHALMEQRAAYAKARADAFTRGRIMAQQAPH
jgi:TPR repeat protein